MKRKIIAILNAKGGVGKSFLATNLVQYFKDREQPYLAIDTDNANSTLKRFHPESHFADLDVYREMDVLFTSLESHPLVVMDGRAASTDQVLNYFSEVGLTELLKTLQAELIVVIPVCHEADSVAQVKLLANTLEGQCSYIIVKNEGLSSQFVIYEQSQARKRIVEQLNGREIILPKLYDWLVAQLNAENLTVSQAIQSDKFTLMDRQRLKSWQRRFYEQLDSVKDRLLP